jgi:hypothetical protein
MIAFRSRSAITKLVGATSLGFISLLAASPLAANAVTRPIFPIDPTYHLPYVSITYENGTNELVKGTGFTPRGELEIQVVCECTPDASFIAPPAKYHQIINVIVPSTGSFVINPYIGCTNPNSALFASAIDETTGRHSNMAESGVGGNCIM